MQISATLVKGKARVQFGANKVGPGQCGIMGGGGWGYSQLWPHRKGLWDGFSKVPAGLMVSLPSLAEPVQPDKSTAVLQIPGSDP